MNLGALGFFKYFNFFAQSFVDATAGLGFRTDIHVMEIVLPVGISFYTFQTLSYTIDLYRRQIPVHRNALEFFAFVAFFPQLVAGPIERARNLLNQFEADRHFDVAQAKDGARQMLWGFFKKIVIADNLASFVNTAYSNPNSDGTVLAAATIFFAFQIYCDFSGYSDIAIGCARLFGFRLMRNFAFPYFSQDVAEFWRRWHISLSTWFRDYVYIPLGGSRGGNLKRLRNVFATFLLSGLWHGANWTFVIWGAIHSLFFLPTLLFRRKERSHVPGGERLFPGVATIIRILVTFVIVDLAWVFFRADSLSHAWRILGRIGTDLSMAGFAEVPESRFLGIGVLLAIEWVQRRRDHPLAIESWPVAARWAVYYALITAIIFLGKLTPSPFIYFQF